MSRVYLSLGSNLGDREDYLFKAVDMIYRTPGILINKVSPIYETDPVGYTEQDKFLNIVVEIDTDILPHKLLKILNDIEDKCNRKRIIKWGPRTIDIDILLYDNIEVNDKNLQIPHQRMWERAFVLIPLCDVNSHIKKGNLLISDIIKGLADKDGVKLYKKDWYKEVTIMKVTKVFTFDSAHNLINYNGKCENLHGHTYKLEITVEGKPDKDGIVIDFVKLKEIVDKLIIQKLDHQYLNDVLKFNTTSENIVVWIWNILENPLHTESYQLSMIRLWETATSYVEYTGTK